MIQTSDAPFSRREVSEDATEGIILMTPIPSYIAMDGFEEEIRVEDLYKRILSLSDQTEKWLIHTKK